MLISPSSHRPQPDARPLPRALHRTFIRLAFLAALVAGPALAADVAIVRVHQGWRDAASFKRISEYFTGKEDTGGRIVIRSQAAIREGYYFLIRTANSGAAREARFKLTILHPAAPAEPRVFEFPARVPAAEAVFELGLTGNDWSDKTADAVAWKIELVAADGAVFATEQSYLWKQAAAADASAKQ